MCPQRSQATSVLGHDRPGMSHQEIRIVEVWGREKYQSRYKLGILGPP